MEARVFVSGRHQSLGNFVRVSLVVGVLVLPMLGVGCESTPMRAYRGAQHYAAGTDALTRNDGALAIAELERAADLVPHASEIQNHLGLAYWSDGRTLEAKTAFEKAIELDCENQVAKANFERLVRSDDFGFDEDANVKIGETDRMDEYGE